MSLLPQEIIRHKRDGKALSATELKAFFHGFLRGEVADYQIGAMLMAILLKGMTDEETAELTRLMRDSGSRLTWEYPLHLVADKHSTGGIGDKTSLIVLPLCVLEGLRVPMMAGRGLGHTGGTLDKLEAIGWNVFASVAQAKQQVERLGGVIMGQTEQIAPLDRRLYAMRDVTSTVESVPLIVGSILSKKLAEGIGCLILDVKFGSGAFMPELAQARALATQLKRVGEACGLKVRCVLSDMGSPLGSAAGNAIEIRECVQVLQNGGPADTRKLSVELAVELVRLAFPERRIEDIRAKMERHLADGSAFDLFMRIAEAQGADVKLLAEPDRLLRAKIKMPVVLSGGGRISSIDVRQLGIAILELGGGRRLVADRIDPWVGLMDMKRVGDRIAPGEPVAIVHANDEASATAAQRLVAAAYQMNGPREDVPLIAEMM